MSIELTSIFNTIEKEIIRGKVDAILMALAVTHGDNLGLGIIAQGISYGIPHVGEESVLLQLRTISEVVKESPANEKVIDLITKIAIDHNKDYLNRKKE